MSVEAWSEDNNHYLAASMRWLRARLRGLAGQASDSDAEAPMRPEDGARGLADTVRALGLAREQAARCEPPPALLLLAQSLGLSDFERDILLMCAATELDPAMAGLMGAAQDAQSHETGRRGAPSFALAMQLLDSPSWDALSPHRPLRYLRLVDLHRNPAAPLTAAPMVAEERVVNYIKGLNEMDDRLSTLLAVVPLAGGPLSATQRTVVDRIVAEVRAAAAARRAPIIELVCPDKASRQDVAEQVCADLGRRLCQLRADALPPAKAELEDIARLWQRECKLIAVALYIEADEADLTEPSAAHSLTWFLGRELGLVFVGLREQPVRPIEGGQVHQVARPTAREQNAAWYEALQPTLESPEASACAAALAGQFSFNLRDLHQLAGQATKGPARDCAASLWAACAQRTRPAIEQLAQRIDSRATWDDLVLPAEALGLLKQIAGQVRGRYRVYEEWGYARTTSRGLGISTLFAGESGTGKTMAAEVLANELQLDLYRIDLSAVVSKYIGETEKNLRRLFDAAEQGGAILFFDEADALFGKRSEVKDSHDRYANIEVNYLLQRLEAFGGLSILATNMKSALDQAFLRRLRFVVNFPFPGIAERTRIWEHALAHAVPRQGVEYERLARFSLAGGHIHNVALNAAFAAAALQTADEGDASVSTELMLAAARTELRKLDRPSGEVDYRATDGTNSRVGPR